MLDRESGECEFKHQGEHGHTFLPNQMLVFWTQAHDFNYLVSEWPTLCTASQTGPLHLLCRHSQWIYTVWVRKGVGGRRRRWVMSGGPASCPSICGTYQVAWCLLSCLLNYYPWAPSHVSLWGGREGGVGQPLPDTKMLTCSGMSTLQ